MDVHIRASITSGLTRRGVDVLTAQEDGFQTADDTVLLDRAGELGRVLFTNDDDLLAIVASRHMVGITFSGIIFAAQTALDGLIINDLELCTKACDIEYFANRVTYLPFR